MSSSFSLAVGTVIALVSCSCGSNNPAAICDSERPCVPEGIWVVSYAMTSTGQSFSSNTIRIDDNGNATILDEQVPDKECPPDATGPGELTTNAELSSDGCTLTAEISKGWCTSGEANCEERTITLDFCNNGSSTAGTGSLDACVCWVNGSPFCNAVDDTVSVDAAAVRSTP